MKQVKNGYLPHKLDILWIQVEPHSGREIGSHNPQTISYNKRPVLVVSGNIFNQRQMIECMPILTHNHLPSPFHQMMLPFKGVRGIAHGYIAPFQILCYDGISRNAKLMDKVRPNLWPTLRYYIKYIFH